MLRQKMQSEAQIDLSNSPLSIVSFRLYVSLPLLSHVPSPLLCSPGASSADTVTSDKASSEGSQEAKAAGEEAEVQGPKVTLANGELCVCVRVHACVCVCACVRVHMHECVHTHMCGQASLYSSCVLPVPCLSLLIMKWPLLLSPSLPPLPLFSVPPPHLPPSLSSCPSPSSSLLPCRSSDPPPSNLLPRHYFRVLLRLQHWSLLRPELRRKWLLAVARSDPPLSDSHLLHGAWCGFGPY